MLAAACRFIVRLTLVALLGLWPLAGQTAASPGDDLAAASPIEAAFTARAGMKLGQFGYDVLAAPGGQPPPAQGAVSAEQVLGVGDAVTVTVRGTRPHYGRHVVNGEGLLLLPDLPPLNAVGRTLAEVRSELQEAYAASQIAADVFVYLTETRRIGVLALGAVVRPGRVEASAFATVFDALLAAGGVRKDGSLRRIKLIRGDQSFPVDVYQLLLRGDGGGATRQLRDGDRILVPPLGPTAALAGPVKRPGVFELPPDHSEIPLGELLDMAGGLLRPGQHRVLRLRIGVDGRERAEPEAFDAATALRDGDIAILAPRREDSAGLVHLDGRALRPGPRALAEVRTLASLADPGGLSPDVWRPFAVLASPAPDGGGFALAAVDLAALARGRGDRALRDGERLIVLGGAEIDFLTSNAVLALLRGDPPPPGALECAGLATLARALAADPRGPLADGPQARLARTLTGADAPCPGVFHRHADLLTFALRHAVLRRGDKGGRPGFFPYADGARAPPGGVANLEEPRVELVGHVRLPGARRLAAAPGLRALLDRGRTFETGVYPLMGVIERFDAASGARRLLAFSPAAVVAGRADVKLADRDRVHVFSAARISMMMAGGEKEAAEALTDGHAMEPPDRAMRAFLAERAVQARGALHAPASLPVAGRAAVGEVIEAAGGLTPQADAGAVEITWRDGTPPRRVGALEALEREGAALGPGDALRVNPRPAAVEAGGVLLEGEVRRPGWYDALRGERLSSLIARAGGLTDDAYPAGAVFLRESVRKREKAALEEQARALERNVALLLQKGEPVRQEDVGLIRQLAAQLRAADPPGRMVVEADPAALARRPERDVLLEPGDHIAFPKRPLTVTVLGEVMAPGALPFESGKDADAYIREAGGLTGMADASRAFMLLPDGRAEPLAISAWNHRFVAPPPGAALVAPPDPRPYGGRELAQTVAEVLSRIALTAASISVISR